LRLVPGGPEGAQQLMALAAPGGVQEPYRKESRTALGMLQARAAAFPQSPGSQSPVCPRGSGKAFRG